MLSNELLEEMRPKMAISYYKDGFLYDGSFDSIPEDVQGAHVMTIFYAVGPDGKFELTSDSYDLYIGFMLDIDKALLALKENNTMSSSIALLEEYQHKGYKKAVSLPGSVMLPLTSRDRAYETKEELKEAIEKIYTTFNTIHYEVENNASKQYQK